MYTLLTRNILKNYRVSNKTIKRRSMVINDVNSLLALPQNSEVIVFFEHSISLSYLTDLQAALNLSIVIVVNNSRDLDLCSKLFETRLVKWDFIDGDLVSSIIYNDEKQMEALSGAAKPKSNAVTLSGLEEEARKLTVMSGASESAKLVASAFLNLLSTSLVEEKEVRELKDKYSELVQENEAIKATLKNMSTDMDDFIKTYRLVQAKVSSRNIIDVIKDTSSVTLPTSITSLVIKNYGVPHLMRFVLALKDCLTTSYDKYTKVVYIAEPDSVSVQEINRSRFFLMDSEVKASDLLKHDMLLCVGNTREPLEFLTTTSNLDILIIIDSRRTTNELITGQTMSMYTAMDLESAINLNLDPNLTITGSEKSLYTLRESDFTGKKRHALRNAELVTRVANTLLGGV